MDYVNVTVKVSKETKEKWESLAKAEGLTIGKMLQKAAVALAEKSHAGVEIESKYRQKMYAKAHVPDIPQDGVAVEPVMTKAVQPKAVPQIAGVSKASEWKPPMPSLPKYQPKPEKRGKK